MDRNQPQTGLGHLAVRLATGAGVWRVSDQDGRRTGLLISEALARAGDLTAAQTAIVSGFLVRYEAAFLKSFQEHHGAAHAR